ncbi:MAG: DUF2752 domain-containing protein [Bryobacterales bacterium]|nr:DUF2752 domain-containing protein [Bryobacterales bacterium]
MIAWARKQGSSRVWLDLRSPRHTALFVAALGAMGAGALFLSPPERSWFLPACPIHAATGFFCPGCGTARALHALLHGRLAEAIDANLLLIALLPALCWLAVLLFADALRDNRIRSLHLPAPLAWGLVGAVALFTLFRNLPDTLPLLGWVRYLAP